MLPLSVARAREVNPEPLDVDSYSPLLVAVREEHADIVPARPSPETD